MRYLIATIGAVLIYAAVFLISLILFPYLPEFLRQYVVIWPWPRIATNNIVGILIASLAAASSFRGTLRHYKAKDLKRQESRCEKP
jgi:hypothetical protein